MLLAHSEEPSILSRSLRCCPHKQPRNSTSTDGSGMFKSIRQQHRDTCKNRSQGLLRSAARRRAACRDRRPQLPAACGVLPHAARLLRAPPCRVRVAAGFPRCGCSLAPRRSKETQKTGDHGGRVRQPERHCLLLTDAGIPHLLEDCYRALRAPASASMPSASPDAPGARAAAHCY